MRVFELDRPLKANALDAPAVARLRDVLAEEAREPLLLRAAGGRHFCSGFDLSLVQAGPQAASALLFALLRSLARRATPLVCVVDGAARGAGVMVAAMADVLVATPGASFALPEIGLGLPSFAALEVLSSRVSPSAAMRLTLSGVRLDAEAARALGLVDAVVEREALDAFVRQALPVEPASASAASAALLRHRADAVNVGLDRAEAATLRWLDRRASPGADPGSA